MLRRIALALMVALPLPAFALAPPPIPPPGPPPLGRPGFTAEELARRPPAETGRIILEDFAKGIALSSGTPPVADYDTTYYAYYFLRPQALRGGLCSAQEMRVILRKATDGKFYPESHALYDVFWMTGPILPPDRPGGETADEVCRTTVAGAKRFPNPPLFDIVSTLADIQTALQAAAGKQSLSYALSCGGPLCRNARAALAGTKIADLSRLERDDCGDRSNQECYRIGFDGASRADTIKVWLQAYRGDTPPRLTRIEVQTSR